MGRTLAGWCAQPSYHQSSNTMCLCALQWIMFPVAWLSDTACIWISDFSAGEDCVKKKQKMSSWAAHKMYAHTLSPRDTDNGFWIGNDSDTLRMANFTHLMSFHSIITLMQARCGDRLRISTASKTFAPFLTWDSCDMGVAVMSGGPVLLQCLGLCSLIASCWLMYITWMENWRAQRSILVETQTCGTMHGKLDLLVMRWIEWWLWTFVPTFVPSFMTATT